MLSYRHGYHVGNHADVLKHVVQLLLLDYLTQKEKPIWIIDTHAGAGLYELNDTFPQKNREYETGIKRLVDAPQVDSAALKRYLRAVRDVNPDKELRQYPGSPYLSFGAMREQDRLRLFDLHSSETEFLESLPLTSDKRVITTNTDGYAGLKALLPPASRRALVLIDPSYELPADYDNTIACIQDSVKRFANGVYALWFPLLSHPRLQQLKQQLTNLNTLEWLCATLTVTTASERGMYGSGMFIINPPWTLRDSLSDALPELVSLLGQDKYADFTLETNSPDNT